MNTSLTLAFATLSSDGLSLFAMGFVLGVAAWTFRQYGRPRRFVELPAAVVEPEFDGRGDEPSQRRAYRDAA